MVIFPFLFWIGFIYSTDALRCLTCSGVIYPRHCHRIHTCEYDEVCFTEKYRTINGEILYNVGCHAKGVCSHIGRSLFNPHQDITMCVDCCTGDACNYAGCGSPGLPPKRGPICFTCDQSRDPSLCSMVTVCDDYYECHIQEVHEYGTIFYQSPCKPMHFCYGAESNIFGRKRVSSTQLSECCTSDLCNFGPQPQHPFDCKYIRDHTVNSPSGVYAIYPRRSNLVVDVYCEMDTAGGGWTVFQRRLNNDVSFDRTWQDYKLGFGNASSDYWIGNDVIHFLTENVTTELYIGIEDQNGTYAYARFNRFSVNNEADGYRLYLGTYSGDAGDSYSLGRNGSMFSTIDRNNDLLSFTSCALDSSSGDWFGICSLSPLNGPIVIGGQRDPALTYMAWYSFKFLVPLKPR